MVCETRRNDNCNAKREHARALHQQAKHSLGLIRGRFVTWGMLTDSADVDLSQLEGDLDALLELAAGGNGGAA
jgi:hypothetical protein